jgi:hypothetical protein
VEDLGQIFYASGRVEEFSDSLRLTSSKNNDSDCPFISATLIGTSVGISIDEVPNPYYGRTYALSF